MGLAASQARFLGLTARKSNVEFKAQQINQARTALANEVSGLHREYNALKPPVNPTIQDFTEISYELKETYQDYRIHSFTKIIDGDNAGAYDVILRYDKEIPHAYNYESNDTKIVTTKDASGQYEKLSIKVGSKTYYYDAAHPDEPDSSLICIPDGADYGKYKGLETVIGNLSTPPYFMYKKGENCYYTSYGDIETTFENQDISGDTYTGSYLFYYGGTIKQEEEIKAVANISQGTNGRMTSISFIDADDPSLIDHEYQVTTSKIQDQDAYNDAMNNYNYENAVYQKELERINLKTQDLQSQDKTLELELNELDTEQNAIKTEMDSVTKVIEDTIDSVFKTFN